ncbi:MAG: T9SS type A sorting domain-containing protein [Chitinophagales bacterium]
MNFISTSIKNQAKTILLFVLLFSSVISNALESSCSNGIDDDGDGFIDMFDTDCSPLSYGFICNKRHYFTRQIGSDTKLSSADVSGTQVTVSDLNTYSGLLFNASFYYNGFIYAFKHTPASNELYQLLNNNTTKSMVIPGLPSSSWNNAACSPTGTVYLLQNGTYKLFMINLSTLAVTSVTLTGISDAASNTIWGDMIIDPRTGDLFCWYHATSGTAPKGLYKIDLTTNKLIHMGTDVQQTMGTLFFETSGKLYGYGSATLGGAQENFYTINKANGATTLYDYTGTTVSQSDGCNCPWRITLDMTGTTLSDITSCSNGAIKYDPTIINSSGAAVSGVVFQDTLDNKWSFTNNATVLQTTLRFIYGVTTTVSISNYNGGTNNVIRINNMNVPTGNSTFTLNAQTTSKAFAVGANIIKSQSFLSNLPTIIGTTELSNDPNTTIVDDSTAITINNYLKPNAGNDQTLCINTSTSATISGSGTGVWTQLGITPSVAIIQSPTSSTTVVNNLNAGGKYQFVWTSNGCTDTVAIDASACPYMTKNFTPTTIQSGSNATLTFTINNSAPYSINQTNISFNDNLPSALKIGTPNAISITGATATISAPKDSLIIRITNLSIAAGSIATITLNVTNINNQLNYSCGASASFTNGNSNISNIIGRLINNVTDQCLLVTAITLPVELADFKGTYEEGKTTLKWLTASELNSDKFVIQRAGADYQFEEIGSIKAAGNSAHVVNYNFVDEHPIAGTNYYRLKQIDNNGSFDYSNVITITASEEIKTEAANIKIYPNPATDVLKIDFTENKDALKEIKLYNAVGTLIIQTSTTETYYTINISDLASGLYFLKINDKNFTVYKQ